MRLSAIPRRPVVSPALLRLAPLCAAGALVLASVAGAQSSRVTGTLRGVTAEQAAEQLSRLAAVPVRVYTMDVPGGPPPNPAAPRADFEWSDASFAQALRQLCERFALRPSRSSAGYILHPNHAAPAGNPGRKVGLIEQNGVRLFARSVTFFENRQVDLVNGAPNVVGGAASLQLYLTAELGDRDAESMAGFQNVIARDDLGHALGQQGAGTYNAYYDGSFPDEWTTTVSLPAPHPKARRLSSVEGDLMVYRKVRPLRVEIPLPLNGKSTRKQVDELSFWVAESSVPPAAPEEEPEPLLARERPASGLILRTRIYSPAQGSIQSRWGWGMVPYLVGASGRTYQANQLPGTQTGSDGMTMVTQHVLSFPNLTEPPARLVWDLLDRSDPVKLFSFKMTDIPLPGPLAFNARAAAPLPKPEPDENRPFYDRAGGALILPVDVPGRPDVDGTLDLGLAARSGTGWGPLRWMQVDVAGGIGRLEHVKPGAYRVVRRFRLARGPLPKEGGWTGEELQATLAAGKEIRLAPLRWGSRPAPAKPGK